MEKGYKLKGGYTIESVISCSGGTSIMYKALDEQKNRVALKELFPCDCCRRAENLQICPSSDPKEKDTFEEAKKLFIDEAKLLDKLKGMGGAPQFYKMFSENGTVYYAMEYMKGRTLLDLLKQNRAQGYERMEIDEAVELLEPIFQAINELHKNHVIHRDVGPDNIFICKKHLRLIDFGNARIQQKGVSRTVDWAKSGYAPIEMYDKSFRQDTWTDIYALAATIYRMITGMAPPDSQCRMSEDKLVSPVDLDVDISPDESATLMKALNLYPDERYSNVMEFYYDMVKDWKYEGILIGLEGQHVGEKIPLTADRKYKLGCREECDIRFAKGTPGVSRIHGSIVWKEEGYAIYVDEGSTYGTRRLDEELIEVHTPFPLNVGEGFILGDDQIFALKRKRIRNASKK